MARVDLTAGSYNQMVETGLDLALATFDTLVLGVDNGVEVRYQNNGFIVLRNDEVGAAVFTFITVQPPNYQSLGLTVPDMTYNVGIGGQLLVPFNAAFKQGSGEVFIDCDVAGKVAVATQ